MSIYEPIEAEIDATRRFETGRYMMLTIKAANRHAARTLFEDLAEAATHLNGRPLTEEAAAERTDAHAYPGYRRIAIGRLRIQVTAP